jgi:anthranilate phosphoribosyltransferase
MLIGAFSPSAAKLMADALSGMQIERALVVHGEPGWDEATPVGEFLLYDVVPGSVKESRRSPEDYGLPRCKPEDLAGGDADHNAKELVRVFRGDDDGAHRDALLLGTSLVLEVTGVVDNPRDGVQLAANTIDSGKTGEFLDSFHEHFSS